MLARAALLPIEREQDRNGFRARFFDQIDRLANRRAGGNDVIDDHDASGERLSHDKAALAVIFGFFTIELPRGTDAVMFREGYSR